MSRRYNPGLEITSVLALLALLMMPSASGTGTDGALGTPSGNIAGGLFGIPTAAIADGAVLKVTLKDSPTSTIPDADWAGAGLAHGTAPRGQQAHGGKCNLARLVALPIGTDAVEPIALTVMVPQGAVSLPAEYVHVSPVMIMRGLPVVVVSIESAAIRDVAGASPHDVEITLVPTNAAPLRSFCSSAGGNQSAADVYMIIAADEYVSELADLVAWKTQAGFDVRLFSLSETGQTREEIRAAVQNAYETWDNPPLYLLLVGDVEDVPTWTENSNVTDHPYACVDGDDFLADLYVGRFTAKKAMDVRVQVAKTVGYESNPDTTDGGLWFNRALLIAGDSGSSTPRATSDWIGEQLTEIGYAQITTCYYDPWWGREGFEYIMKPAIDSGVSIVSYRGWAWGDFGWQPPEITVQDIPLLENGWRLPVVFGIVCHTGNYGNEEDCFGEVWLKEGTCEEPQGAVGFIGTAEGYSHSRWNDAVVIGITEQFCHAGIRRMGPLLTAAKVGLIEQFPTELYTGETGPQYEEQSVEYYHYIYNLLGDPSLPVWTAKPRPLHVHYPAEVSTGQNFIAIQVLTEDDSAPVTGARVAIVQAGRLIGFAVTGEDGWAAVSCQIESADPVTIAVTGENLFPWQIEIPAAAAQQYLVCEAAAVSGGGHLIPGTPVNIDIDVRNTGTLALSAASGTIEALAEVEVLQDAVDFGGVGVGESTRSLSPAQITVAARTENGERLRFLLHTTESGADTTTSEFWLTAEAPELLCVGVSDGDDDRFDPGEDTDLFLVLGNSGIAAGDIEATLRVLVPDELTIADSLAAFAEIPTGVEATNTADPFRVIIPSGIPVGTVIPMELVAESAGGPSTLVHFNIVVGLTDFSAPLGPDEYGYYCLDSADIEYPDQVPVYRWIECSPTYRGQGTALNIHDGTGGHWYDHRNTKVIELPFTFTYYSREYNSIQVDDDGWIAFDTTYFYDIRNWNMPGKWGCACQVAAFWDNLGPMIEGSDGIYVWHDEENHCFVIEWSRLMNWEDSTDDFHTFEILLLDPAYYSTPTGDGEIVFQYKQIVNDDWERMYSTVGIEDHTEERGLLYSYSNQYAPGAAPLTPGLAIKFTTERPVFQPIELGRFEAFWVFAGGAGGAVPGGSEGDGGSDAWVVGNGSQLREGILVRWEFTDERPLTAMELYRVEAEPAGAWGRAHKVHEGMLAPRSGSLFDAVAGPSADSNAGILYRMIGVGPFGKKRTIGEVLCTGEPGGMPMLRLPEGNLVGGEVRILCGAGNGSMQALTVYDVSGRSIRDLLSGVVGRTGAGVITWDGRDDRGNSVPGGVYWVRLSTSAGQRTARLVVIR